MNTATVYSKPNCQQCRMTYAALDNKRIPYVIVDVTENAAALAYVTEELGYSAAPVVVIDDHDHWVGFRPDKISGLEFEHRDTHQTYEDGMFITWCTCGEGFTGTDPDDADATAMNHCYPEEA